jgi:hypothetical protein
MTPAIGGIGMARRIATLAVIGIAVALAPRAGLAWGQQGHRVVALIADRALQQGDGAVRAKVLALLATDKGSKLTKNDIASEATWADVLREKSEEARFATANWHSVRMRPNEPDLKRACFGRKPLPSGYPASRGPADNCSVDKIEQFAAELKDPGTAQGERLAALQFLLNLTGDVHDPLNAIDRGDQGGQCIALQIGDKPPVRLSSYWQDKLVADVVGPDAAKGAARIAASVAASDAQKWAGSAPEDWAEESFQVAKGVAYDFAGAQPAGKHSFAPEKGRAEPCQSVELYKVGPDYETKALAAVRIQLARAGLRLAALLRDNLK